MKKSIKPMVASLGAVTMLSSAGIAHAHTFNPFSAGDGDGGGEVNLFVDLGSVQRVDDIGVAWGRGNSQSYNFEVRARRDASGSWDLVRRRADSSGSTVGIETYNIDDVDARQVRIKVFSTEGNRDFANVTEFEVYGTRGRSGNSFSSSK